MVEVGCNVQSKFNEYYFDFFKSLSKIFIIKNLVWDVIEILRDQKVNIIEVLKNCFKDVNDVDQLG